MGSFALLNATTWLAGYDFTTRLNELSVAVSCEELENTTFGKAGAKRRGRSRTDGLRDVETELNGFWESDLGDSVDAAAFAGLGSEQQVATHSVDGEDTVAYFYKTRKFTYQLGDEIGSVLPYTLNLMGSGGEGVIRGRVAKDPGTVSAAGVTGVPVNLGDVAADEHLYATLHVLSAGTSVTVAIESDTTSAFTTPTTVATFVAQTATGGVWLPRVAGPITDTWFRFNVTAITGSFVIAGAIGAQ